MPYAIQLDRTGGPEVLRWREVEVGEPGPGEVRLRQAAAGLNFIDVYHRRGIYPQPLPLIPGVEGAGTIVAVGENVEGFAVGDRVAYVSRQPGSYAEERLIPARRLVRLPDALALEAAAAMMLQGLTARMLLRRVHEVKPGETILVHAAAGGTGLILCEWAASLGATVIGTVSSEEKAALARAHGCRHAILYTRQDFVAEVLRLTGGEKLPVVYDSVGADTFARSLDCVRPHGLMVSFGQASGSVPPFDPVLLAQKGSLFLTRPLLFDFVEDPEELRAAADDLFAMILSGRLRVNIHHRHKLRDAAVAHAALEGRATTGSTVLLA